jgi:GDPmannose 4,6-dehydratase
LSNTALKSGVTGQDDACLSELLLGNGYLALGIKRRSSLIDAESVDPLCRDPHEPGWRFLMRHENMTDAINVIRVLRKTRPDEIYKLAAQPHVQVSYETPEYVANSGSLDPVRLVRHSRQHE